MFKSYFGTVVVGSFLWKKVIKVVKIPKRANEKHENSSAKLPIAGLQSPRLVEIISPPLVGVGLTKLLNSGDAKAPPAPLLMTAVKGLYTELGI